MSEVIIARKNTLKKWGVGLKNKDKKGKEQIKKTKFSDIDLFEEGHEEEPDELDLIDGLIKDPATTQDKEHNAYLRLMHEYKAEYAKREKCIKVGILLIIISAVVFLALMFSLDSKTFFLTLWIIFIISGIAVMTRIDYRCYKYEKILGIKNTDKEDDLEKMKNDIDKTISNAKTELENAKANIETTIESAKKDISRLSGMKTRERKTNEDNIQDIFKRYKKDTHKSYGFCGNDRYLYTAGAVCVVQHCGKLGSVLKYRQYQDCGRKLR